jgi:hypothetical protein
MITIILNNSMSRVVGLDKSLLKNLRMTVSYFNMSTWIRTKNRYASTTLLIDEDGYFPTGLVKRVSKYFDERYLPVNIADNRIIPKHKSINLIDRLIEPPLYPEQILGAHAIATNTSGVLEMPTGIGKSRVIKEALIRTQRPTLIITPSGNLRQQTYEYLTESFGTDDVGLLKVHHDKPIIVTNFHALSSKDPNYFKQFSQLIFDEFHHCFTPLTKISGSKSKSYKTRTIEEIYKLFHNGSKPKVISWNGKAWESKLVINAMRYPAPPKMLKVRVQDEDGNIKEFIVTKNHKFLTDNGKIRIEQMKIGDKLTMGLAPKTRQENCKSKKHREIIALANKNRSIEVRSKQSLKIKSKIADGSYNPFGRGTYGNGGALTPTQIYLLDIFKNFEAEVAIGLKDGEFPRNYKIDLANADLKIGIEVDGTSHKGREAQDLRKEIRLGSIGWKIVRIPENYSKEQLLVLKRLIQQMSGSMI